MNTSTKTWFYFFGWLALAVTISVPFFFTHDRTASLKAELMRPDGTILKAFFTPYDNIKEMLIALIKNEQQSISMMAYLLSDRHVIQALQDAAAIRKIAVTVVIDYQTATNNKYYKNFKKLAHFVTLRVFQPMEDGIMHNKFVIFGSNIDQKPLVWTGSFNFTTRAQQHNIENALVSNDAQLITQYQNTFKALYAFTSASEQILNAHPIPPKTTAKMPAFA